MRVRVENLIYITNLAYGSVATKLLDGNNCRSKKQCVQKKIVSSIQSTIYDEIMLLVLYIFKSVRYKQIKNVKIKNNQVQKYDNMFFGMLNAKRLIIIIAAPCSWYPMNIKEIESSIVNK